MAKYIILFILIYYVNVRINRNIIQIHDIKQIFYLQS